ncbi:hypothetical protein J6590_033986 [Homalodisca vitripennis]|nr:hypothetical protein J6590_033986 [Homalodisca vitripennis]
MNRELENEWLLLQGDLSPSRHDPTYYSYTVHSRAGLLASVLATTLRYYTTLIPSLSTVNISQARRDFCHCKVGVTESCESFNVLKHKFSTESP